MQHSGIKSSRGMVDDVKMEIPFYPPEAFRQKVPFPFELNGLIFRPEFNKNGDVVSYSCQLENLYIKLISGKLILMNSLHKFWHGNNHSDFYWEEIQNCLQSLGEAFGEGFWKSRITRLTAAVNLPCDPKTIIERLISYNGNPMEPMRPRDGRAVYGKRFTSTHYGIKVYDKQFEVKKDTRVSILPVLRIEKEMKMPYFQKRKRNPVPIYTSVDLTNPHSATLLAHELNEVVFSLGFDYGISPMAMKDFHDASVVIFMSNPEYRKVLKRKSNYRTNKGYEKRLQDLREEFGVEDYKEKLLLLLNQKIDLLKSVPVH